MNALEMFSLKGKVAIVTGGSGKYGKQIVSALTQAGARVYTASRNIENNEKYAKELCSQGFDVYAESVDQGNETDINDFAGRILKKEGKVDILVNNSVLRIMKSINDSGEVFEKSLKVNATGLFLITRAFGNIMAKAGSGSIINIGSYMGILGPDETLYTENPWMSAINDPDYFFHKGGMVNLTKFFAALYGPNNVRCNVLNLGGLFSNQDERFVKRYCERTFLHRMANESDLMGSIVFLASDASSYLTGASIPIDGGYSAK